MDMHKIIRTSQRSLKHHTPHILVGAGVAGLLASIPLSFRAALVIDEISRYELGVPARKSLRCAIDKNDTLISFTDAVKLFGPALAAPAITGVLSTAAVIGSSVITTNRTAVLAGAYAVSDRMLEEYKASVKRNVGEDAAREIQEDIAVEKLHQAPLAENSILRTGYGDTLCFDSLSGRYFRSDVESIRKAMNDLNNELFHDTFVPLNRFYDYLGLEHIRLGEELGWTTDDLVELSFSSQLTPENAPCVVVLYVVEPKLDPYRSI